ncbi:MAG: hypothetical protein MZW92_19300 [Comamonadaceae bacterium]|nr:hypothetical protein [Comamonadaceae bacterium]
MAAHRLAAELLLRQADGDRRPARPADARRTAPADRAADGRRPAVPARRRARRTRLAGRAGARRRPAAGPGRRAWRLIRGRYEALR